MNIIFDIILLIIYSVSVLLVSKYGYSFVNLGLIYLFFLRFLKFYFYLFSVTKEYQLSNKTILNISVWTFLFFGASYPYFLLEGSSRLVFLNVYFVFMSLIGLTGFTILIYGLNVLQAVKFTFKTMEPKMHSLNFVLSLVIINAIYFMDFDINLYYIMPFLLYFVTKKYIRDFNIKIDKSF